MIRSGSRSGSSPPKPEIGQSASESPPTEVDRRLLLEIRHPERISHITVHGENARLEGLIVNKGRGDNFCA